MNEELQLHNKLHGDGGEHAVSVLVCEASAASLRCLFGQADAFTRGICGSESLLGKTDLHIVVQFS